MKRYKCFYVKKNLNRQNNCIVSNPKIFKGEAIQVLLRKINLNWQSDCITSNPRIFRGEAIQGLLRKKNLIQQSKLYHFTPQKLFVMKQWLWSV
jgi:hypothetical protein